jgi:exosome complex component RRP40
MSDAAANALLTSLQDGDKEEPFVPRVVLPGDSVKSDLRRAGKQIRIGKGLSQTATDVIATKAGALRFRTPNRFWVENAQRRYSPVVGDAVIGIVVSRHAEEYKLNIGGSACAMLPALAFDGASKRNKPNFDIGTAVYARVEMAHRDMAPEVTCTTTAQGKKKDWVTGQSIFGELKGGHIFSVPLALARALRSPRSAVLNCLGKAIPFEIAVGANGLVWVHSKHPAHTIVVCNAIRNSEHLDDVGTEVMCRKLVAAARHYDAD